VLKIDVEELLTMDQMRFYTETKVPLGQSGYGDVHNGRMEELEAILVIFTC
jgi:hypothetical protein